MGYLLAVIRAVLVLLLIVLFISGFLFSLLFRRQTKENSFRLRRNWLRLVLKILNVKVELNGSPPTEPALYISNHRSFSDPLILLRYLEAYVIAKAEVSSYPLINKGATMTGIMYVDRDNPDSRQATREKLVEVIESGSNVLVYPEGTVGRYRHTLPLKKGTFMEAAEKGFAIVPVALEYKYDKDLWYKPNFISHYFQQFCAWSTPVKLKFGPVLKGENGNQLHDEAHNWLNTTLENMQEGWSEINYLEDN